MRTIPFALYNSILCEHNTLVLVTNRRIGEAFDICASDKETVICSLRVKHITGDHDTDPDATDICADLEVFEDKSVCTFGFPDAAHGITVHFEDKLELFDVNKKTLSAKWSWWILKRITTKAGKASRYLHAYLSGLILMIRSALCVDPITNN